MGNYHLAPSRMKNYLHLVLACFKFSLSLIFLLTCYLLFSYYEDKVDFILFFIVL